MGHEKIPMPTEAEKQQAIARILDTGLPRRTALDPVSYTHLTLPTTSRV